MSTNPFDYFEVITQKKDMDLDPCAYNPYLVNRSLSYFADTVLYAQEMNQRREIPPELQFKFLEQVVTKKVRRSRWAKKDETEIKLVEYLKERYSTNETGARFILKLANSKERKELEEQIFEGGRQ